MTAPPSARTPDRQPIRRMRSRCVQAALIGSTAFALAGCEEPVDLTFFQNVDACRAEAETSSEFSVADCVTAFEQAQAEHAVLAPRYDELALCEEQHGEGACGRPEEAGGAPDAEEAGEVAQAGGPSFMPFFMGYMIGNLMSGNSRAVHARPLYADTRGNWFSTTGNRMPFKGNGTKVQANPSALRTPSLSRVAAPMTRATVTARGGFGAARSASFGG